MVNVVIFHVYSYVSYVSRHSLRCKDSATKLAKGLIEAKSCVETKNAFVLPKAQLTRTRPSEDHHNGEHTA